MKRKELLQSREYWITTIQLGLYEMMEDYRKEHKLNKTQLAEKLGVTKGYISQILNGDFDHKISKLVDTSIALNRVPIIKYENMNKYVLHDALNISTSIGIVKQLEVTYDFSDCDFAGSDYTTINGDNQLNITKDTNETGKTEEVKYAY